MNWRGKQFLYIVRDKIGKRRLRTDQRHALTIVIENMSQRAAVILYSKPGCHLCDEMKAEIASAGCADHYNLREVNIESDSELRAEYRYDVPVLLIDGVEFVRHRLRAEDFKARILEATKHRMR
jgi:glutaredoxin